MSISLSIDVVDPENRSFGNICTCYPAAFILRLPPFCVDRCVMALYVFLDFGDSIMIWYDMLGLICVQVLAVID
jgi:hypothetical protein